jgi:hypothetical protein
MLGWGSVSNLSPIAQSLGQWKHCDVDDREEQNEETRTSSFKFCYSDNPQHNEGMGNRRSPFLSLDQTVSPFSPPSFSYAASGHRARPRRGHRTESESRRLGDV